MLDAEAKTVLPYMDIISSEFHRAILEETAMFVYRPQGGDVKIPNAIVENPFSDTEDVEEN